MDQIQKNLALQKNRPVLTPVMYSQRSPGVKPLNSRSHPHHMSPEGHAKLSQLAEERPRDASGRFLPDSGEYVRSHARLSAQELHDERSEVGKRVSSELNRDEFGRFLPRGEADYHTGYLDGMYDYAKRYRHGEYNMDNYARSHHHLDLTPDEHYNRSRRPEEYDDLHRSGEYARSRATMSPEELHEFRSDLAETRPRDEFGRFVSSSQSSRGLGSPQARRLGRVHVPHERMSPAELHEFRSEVAQTEPRDVFGRFVAQ